MGPLMLLDGAVSTYTPVTASDWSAVTTAISEQISVSTVAAVIASCVTACIALVFFWWGVRKVVRMIMTAFKRGKLKI